MSEAASFRLEDTRRTHKNWLDSESFSLFDQVLTILSITESLYQLLTADCALEHLETRLQSL